MHLFRFIDPELLPDFLFECRSFYAHKQMGRYLGIFDLVGDWLLSLFSVAFQEGFLTNGDHQRVGFGSYQAH